MATEGNAGRNIKLFLGNLSFDTTDEDIRKIARTCGNLRFCIIRRWPGTQKSRGYGHVEFRHEEECLKAFEAFHNKEIKGRIVRVDWCDDYHRDKYPQYGSDSLKRREREGGGIEAAGHAASTHPYKALSDEREMSASKRKRPSDEEHIQAVDAEGRITPLFHRLCGDLSLSDLIRIVGLIQKLTKQCPDAARSILTQNPHLCYPVLHAQSLLGMLQLDFQPLPANRLAEAAAFQKEYDLLHANEHTIAELVGNNEEGITSTHPSDVIESISPTLRLNFNAHQHTSLVTSAVPPLHSSASSIDNSSTHKTSHDEDVDSSTMHTSILRMDIEKTSKPSPYSLRSWSSGKPVLMNTNDVNTSTTSTQTPMKMQNEQSDHLEDPDIPLASTPLVNEVINDKHMLENITKAKPQQIAQWPEKQRRQVLSIRRALLARGYVLANDDDS